MPTVPGSQPVQVVGVAQGLVVGDHNTVHQHYIQRSAFRPQEAPPLPPHWVARTVLIAEARAALQAGANPSLALVGMGGAGKSRLAAALALDLDAHFPGGCFWVDLAAGPVEAALQRMGLALGHDLSSLGSPENLARTVRSLLQGKGVLLVLDDVWATADTTGLLPPPAGCAALITTRNEALAAELADTVLSLPPLDAEQAGALLTQALQGVPLPLPPLLSAWVQVLGGLPLALELTARLARHQARRPGFDWTSFVGALTHSGAGLGAGLGSQTVRQAFELSWTRALDPEGQRAFALLGIFEAGGISHAAAAAAWGVALPAAQALCTQLLDLSLAQADSADALRLHPLLVDFAREKAQALPEAERRQAHAQVADHWLARLVLPPRTLAELQRALNAHWHAGQAGDAARAAQVYPWLPGGANARATPVPGFLIDHGQPSLRVKHERVALALLAPDAVNGRMWQQYKLGEALVAAGALQEGVDALKAALAVLDSPAMNEGARAMSMSKFCTALAQAQSQLDDRVGAEATYRRSLAHDRILIERGDVGGARAGALLSTLLIGDLQRDPAQAEALYLSAWREALEYGEARSACMAAARLAEHWQSGEPERATALLEQVLALVKNDASQSAERHATLVQGSVVRQDAFAGRQGARYARRLADVAASLSYNGASLPEATAWLLGRSVQAAGQGQSWVELGYSLYAVGNWLEHQHLMDRSLEWPGAWAAYVLSEQFTESHEGGTPLNALQRVRTRVEPHLTDPVERAAVAQAVADDPWGLVQAALGPAVPFWRPC